MKRRNFFKSIGIVGTLLASGFAGIGKIINSVAKASPVTLGSNGELWMFAWKQVDKHGYDYKLSTNEDGSVKYKQLPQHYIITNQDVTDYKEIERIAKSNFPNELKGVKFVYDIPQISKLKQRV